jgi:hypothetical protein
MARTNELMRERNDIHMHTGSRSDTLLTDLEHKLFAAGSDVQNLHRRKQDLTDKIAKLELNSDNLQEKSTRHFSSTGMPLTLEDNEYGNMARTHGHPMTMRHSMNDASGFMTPRMDANASGFNLLTPKMAPNAGSQLFATNYGQSKTAFKQHQLN